MDGRAALHTISPLDAYRAKLAAGELSTDPAQAFAAERLQALWVRLRGYTPRARAEPARLWTGCARARSPTTPLNRIRMASTSLARLGAGSPC